MKKAPPTRWRGEADPQVSGLEPAGVINQTTSKDIWQILSTKAAPFIHPGGIGGSSVRTPYFGYEPLLLTL